MSQRARIIKLCQTALMTAVLCILAVIAVPLPFTPVPLSLATLAVMLSGALLGPLYGMAAVCTYLLLGLVGLPVFSSMQSGIGVLAGPTGGFLVGYLFMAFVAGLRPALLMRKSRRFLSEFAVRTLMMTLATAVLYLFGCVWFVLWADVSFGAALTACVLPFLPGDALKIVAAGALATRFARIRRTA